MNVLFFSVSDIFFLIMYRNFFFVCVVILDCFCFGGIFMRIVFSWCFLDMFVSFVNRFVELVNLKKCN